MRSFDDLSIDEQSDAERFIEEELWSRIARETERETHHWGRGDWKRAGIPPRRRFRWRKYLPSMIRYRTNELAKERGLKELAARIARLAQYPDPEDIVVDRYRYRWRMRAFDELECPECNGSGIATEYDVSGMRWVRSGHPCRVCGGKGSFPPLLIDPP
jgi:hypothetical protein